MIPDKLIGKGNKELIKSNLKNKIKEAASEPERAMYMLATKMVCNDIIKNQVHLKSPSKVERLDLMIEKKLMEIQASREEWRNRIDQFRRAKDDAIRRAAQKASKE